MAVLYRWISYKQWWRFIGVSDDPDSSSFKYKQKIAGETGNDGTKDFLKNCTIKI